MICLHHRFGTLFFAIALLSMLSFMAPANLLAEETEYSDAPRQPRDSTFAARKMGPKLGRRQATTLKKSNPYEARKVSIIREQERYEVALKKWERKVEIAQRRAMIKKQKADEVQMAKLRKEQQKKLAQDSRLSKKQDGRFQPLGFLFGSKKSDTSSTKLAKTATPAGQEPLFPEDKSAADTRISLGDTSPEVQEEPSFFQRLKWALFGK